MLGTDEKLVTKKGQLHNSSIELLERCGELFSKVHVDGVRLPSAPPLVQGTAVHDSIHKDLKAKLDTGQLMALGDVQDAARDAVMDEWVDGGVMLDEEAGSEREQKGGVVDGAVRLATLHHIEVAPHKDPIPFMPQSGMVGIELPWVVELKNYPVDLAGRMDLVEAIPHDSGEGEAFRLTDWKTSKKSPNQNAADMSAQGSMYSMALHVQEGSPAQEFHQITLVNLKRGAKVAERKSSRDAEDHKFVLRRVERAIDVIEGGNFMPARVGSDWWCSEKYCPLARAGSCSFFRNKVTLPAAAVPEKG